MKKHVKIASNAGFCFGVRRAIDLTDKTARNRDAVYTLGPLIHNPQEVRRLAKNGVKAINRVNGIEGYTLIIRTHGITSKLKTKLETKNLELVDATCPFVKRAQDIVKKLSDDNYQIIIVGDKTHPEVIGLISYCNGNCYVVEKKSDIKVSKLIQRIGIISQTTQSIENFNDIVKHIKKYRPNLKIYNTICRATIDRQAEALKLAKRVDVMFVVGGKNSGNTKRLAEICRQYAKTYLIETAKEIKAKWIKRKRNIGITAGASTPDWIIKSVETKINKYFQKGVPAPKKYSG